MKYYRPDKSNETKKQLQVVIPHLFHLIKLIEVLYVKKNNC